MNKVVFMFPGQGAQYAGMGKDFYETIQESKKIYDIASEATGLDITNLCFTENDKLDITEYTQVAMLTTSIAILEAIKKRKIPLSNWNAGLSLGEYGALVASEVLTFADAIKVVRKRGIYMQEAVPVGLGAMAAVLGMETEVIEKVCERIEGIVQIANYNCPGQVAISGEKKAVEAAIEALKQAGARRIVPLKVSGPFHSKMLIEAGEKLEKELENIFISPIKIPYLSNVTADLVTKEDEVKELLKKQVFSSVRWQQTIEKLLTLGADTFIEIGPGKTLSAFVKKINREVAVYNVENVKDLEKLEAQF